MAKVLDPESGDLVSVPNYAAQNFATCPRTSAVYLISSGLFPLELNGSVNGNICIFYLHVPTLQFYFSYPYY